MQVMSLLVIATSRLIYCPSNIVEGKTYVHKRLIYILVKLHFTLSSYSVFSCKEIEDISSVSRVAFGDGTFHFLSAGPLRMAGFR